ncbi:MAG: heme-binding protein [Candidatus Caenarcaniphilales bacterium]|nr:heme-binding protein [Candidatus Caenarcaniphilales bacterium]
MSGRRSGSEGSRETAGDDGFRILANYIFVGNVSREELQMTSPVNQAPSRSVKIAMKSPVTQKPLEKGDAGNSTWVVQFMMPSSYSLESLPKAYDERIGFRYTQPAKVIAIRFEGSASDRKIRKQTQILRDYVAREGHEIEGDPAIAYYDSPFTLPWERRNEIQFRLK